MKVCTTGLTVRLFNVTIPTGHGRVAKSIGNTFNEDRLAQKRSTEPDTAENKALGRKQSMFWCLE